MASLSKTGLLRQTLAVSTTKRLVTAGLLPTRAFRPTYSSVLTRQSTSPILSLAPRFAPFSTTTQKKILPPGPQVIQGGVNDPAPVPPASPIHGSYHWSFERILSIGLIPLTIVPFTTASVSPALDAIFIFTIIVHSHIGFQACVTDYFSTRQHPTLRKLMDWMLNIATVLVAIAFYEFETNDVGVTEAVKRIWHAGANDATIGKADVGALGHDGKLKHLKE